MRKAPQIPQTLSGRRRRALQFRLPQVADSDCAFCAFFLPWKREHSKRLGRRGTRWLGVLSNPFPHDLVGFPISALYGQVHYFRVRRDPGTIAKVTRRTTSPVSRLHSQVATARVLAWPPPAGACQSWVSVL